MSAVYLNFNGQTVATTSAAHAWLSTTAYGQTLTATSLATQMSDQYGGGVMIGGTGDTTFAIMDSGEQISVASSTSVNTVDAWADFSLVANINNITLEKADLTAVGNSGNDLMISGGLEDTLIAGSGSNVLVDNGSGGVFFQFNANMTTDVIYGFQASGTNHDIINLTGSNFTNFTDLQSHLTQQGSDTLLTLSSTQAILIRNTLASSLTSSDFGFGVNLTNVTPTFDDEFNSLSLWNPATGTGTWKTNFISGNQTGVYSWMSRTLQPNNEQEIYVDPSYAGSGTTALGLNPFSISNGVLDITAAKTPTADLSVLNNFKYTSGLITTEKSFSQTYGYFEMRAELPSGKGVWPAFWLLPSDGSWPPELDVMEQIGGGQVFQTAHSVNSSGATVATGFSSYVPTNSTGFHTYGVLWTSKTIAWYVDGVEVASTPTPADMNKPMYMLVNLAVGGNWPGSPSADFTTAQMQVDYVRAYSLASMNLADGAPPASIQTSGSSSSTPQSTPSTPSTPSATPPTSAADSYTAKAGHALSVSAAQGVLANDTDHNGLTMTAALATNGGPQHGTLTLNGDGSFTYTPNAGFAGTDSFTYVAKDNSSTGTATTVTLTVGATAPTAGADAYSAKAGAALSVNAVQGVLANDVDNNGLTLTASLATNGGPQHGTLTLNADGSFTYTPTAGYSGTDSVTYVAKDSLGSSTATTVTLNVGSTTPTSHADTYAAQAGHALSVSAAQGVLANDVDGNGLTLTAALAQNGGPQHGALTLNADGSFTYTANAGYVGTDSFTYIASDSLGAGTPTTVTLNVGSTAPTSHADAYGVKTGASITESAAQGVLANDVDNNGLTLSASLAANGGPQHGTLTLNADGSFTYTPTAGYAGTDSFTYVASDSLTAGTPTTVTLNVGATPIVTHSAAYSLRAGSPLTTTTTNGVLSFDTDSNGLTMTASLVANGGPAHGTLTLNADGTFTYTPAAGFIGADSFTYVASDGATTSAPVTVGLNVVAAPPLSHTDYYTVHAGSAATVSASAGVLANDTDPNGLTLSAALSGSGPAHGTLTFNANGSFVYTPNAGYVGTDSFKYVATDGQASGAVTTVNLTVTSSAPTGVADSYSATTGTALHISAIQGVLANDADHNGMALSASLTVGPSHGTLTLDANGSFIYTPNAGYVGTDTFKYTPSDGLGSGYGTLVTITVGAATTTSTTSTATSSSAPMESQTSSSIHVATSSTDHNIGSALIVDSAFSYSLAGLNAKTLVLTGTGNLTGTANALGDHITANSGNDVLVAGAGNDTLTGGSGTDTFVFKPGAGHDTVISFRGHDVIDISAYLGHGYTPTLTNVGYNTEISFSNGDQITLLGINKSMLIHSSVGFTH